MSATVNENENPFVVGDRVITSSTLGACPKKKGTVVKTSGISSEVKLDNKITIITFFKNLRKITKKV